MDSKLLTPSIPSIDSTYEAPLDHRFNMKSFTYTGFFGEHFISPLTECQYFVWSCEREIRRDRRRTSFMVTDTHRYLENLTRLVALSFVVPSHYINEKRFKRREKIPLQRVLIQVLSLLCKIDARGAPSPFRRQFHRVCNGKMRPSRWIRAYLFNSWFGCTIPSSFVISVYFVPFGTWWARCVASGSIFQGLLLLFGVVGHCFSAVVIDTCVEKGHWLLHQYHDCRRRAC